MQVTIKPVKSVALLATLTILVMVVAASYLLLNLRTRELHHAQREASTLTHTLVEQTEKTLATADVLLQGIQERLAVPFGRQLPLDSRVVQLLLNARGSGQKHISSIFLLDADGTMVNSSREFAVPMLSLADRAYFQTLAAGSLDAAYLDGPLRSRIDQAWTLYLARRLEAPDGRFRGVLVAGISVAELEKSLGAVQLDYVRPIGLYRPDGTLVASVPHRADTIGLTAPELAGVQLPTQAGTLQSLPVRLAAEESETMQIGRLAGYPLLLGVTDNQAQSLAHWRDTALPIAVGTLLVSIFTAAMALYLIGKLRRKDALTLALHSANDRYQHTVDSVMDAIVAVDQNMRILLFNPAAEKMFGRSAGATLGQPLELLIPARFRQDHVAHMDHFTLPDQAAPRTIVPRRGIVGLRADGTEFPIESTFSKSVVGGQLQLTAVLRDATQKRLAEQELQEANRQLRGLANSLTQVREQERTRISRELHDDLGQQLTGLKLSLSWLGNRIKDGRETAAQNVDDMRHQLDGAIASVRRIAAELRPRVLDDLDFAEALTWQTAEFTRHSGLEVTLNLEARELIRDNELATALFRIVQEALTNVVRHAEASQVRISLTERAGCVVLGVQDNGRGFDSRLRQAGVGLVGMRERCLAIGAEFSIESQAGQGARIAVSVPLASLQQDKVAA